MKPNKPKALVLILSACFLCITAFSYAQFKTDRIKDPASSAMPVVTKGYYSIFNNAQKLNLSAGKKTSSHKNGDRKPESRLLPAPKKGYYSIGRNAEKKREQMASDGIDFFRDTPSGIIQNLRWPVINKGYYSIGNNAQKLQQ